MSGENNTEATTTYRDKARPKVSPLDAIVPHNLLQTGLGDGIAHKREIEDWNRNSSARAA